MTVQLHAFTCGHLTLPRFFMLAGEEGMITVPIPAYLVTHPQGRVLFDSGLHVASLDDGGAHVGELIATYHMLHFEAGEEIGVPYDSSIHTDRGRSGSRVDIHDPDGRRLGLLRLAQGGRSIRPGKGRPTAVLGPASYPMRARMGPGRVARVDAGMMGSGFVHSLGQALLMAAGMAWRTGWTLVLGFAISAALQALVPAERVRARLGGRGARSVALAAAFGAASSSCSYAAAAVMRTLLRKGASLAASLAFLIAATNLVLELGVILYLLLGWQFMLAEWLGGIVLIAAMVLIVRLTRPERLVEAARHAGEGEDGDTGSADPRGWRERLADPATGIAVARNFAMEWRMLWKDLAIGFLVGGLVSAFVPQAFWQSLFLTNAPAWIRIPANALIGPVVAMLTFVCSIGNVPLAAVLWGGGATFGGVVAFLYGDLIVLPLLDVYRRYYGWRMAAYLALVLFAAMAIAATLVDLGFAAVGAVPTRGRDIHAALTTFAIDYTFWLNLVFGAVALVLFVAARRHADAPMQRSCCSHGG